MAFKTGLENLPICDLYAQEPPSQGLILVPFSTFRLRFRNFLLILRSVLLKQFLQERHMPRMVTARLYRETCRDVHSFPALKHVPWGDFNDDDFFQDFLGQ